jgi:hypothetical protein
MGLSFRRKLLLSALGLSALAVPVLAVPWFGKRRLYSRRSLSRLPGPYIFPPGFLWGTATAAYQIEHTQDDDWSSTLLLGKPSPVTSTNWPMFRLKCGPKKPISMLGLRPI